MRMNQTAMRIRKRLASLNRPMMLLLSECTIVLMLFGKLLLRGVGAAVIGAWKLRSWLLAYALLFIALSRILSIIHTTTIILISIPLAVLICLVERRYHLFFVVRKDVDFKWKIILIVFSVAAVIGGYSLLSYRMHKKNAAITTIPNLSQYIRGVKTVFSKGDADIILDDISMEDEPAAPAASGFKKHISRAADFLKELKGRPIVDDTIASLTRFFLGFSIGLALSIVLGILMGSFWWVEALFILPLTFFAAIPGTAMFAIYFAIIRTEIQLYIAMIAFGILPGITQTVYLSVKKDIPRQYFLQARTLGLQ
jgi:hypothetical protein